MSLPEGDRNMKLKLLRSFLKVPLSIKIRIIRLSICRLFKLNCRKHDIIWGSVFLYVIETNAKISYSDNLYYLEITYYGVPLKVRIRPGKSTDVFTFFQLFIAKEYGQFFERTKEAKIKTVIDCGANVGYFTLQALARFPSSNVLSVEPDTGNLNEIITNVKLNNLQEQCQPLKGAIWPRSEHLIVDTQGGEWEYKVHSANEISDLGGYTLKSLIGHLESSRIDILKIDIEGTEDALFKDPQFIETLKSQVQYLVMEIHDKVADRTYIHQKILECGFDYFDHGELTICTKSDE